MNPTVTECVSSNGPCRVPVSPSKIPVSPNRRIVNSPSPTNHNKHNSVVFNNNLHSEKHCVITSEPRSCPSDVEQNCNQEIDTKCKRSLYSSSANCSSSQHDSRLKAHQANINSVILRHTPHVASDGHKNHRSLSPPGSHGTTNATNSLNRISLQQLSSVRKAIRIKLYRNGDKYFKGIIYPLSMERLRSFDAFLEDLTRILVDQVSLPKGVRSIFTVNGVEKIKSLDKLKAGHSYVVSSTDNFIKLNYERISGVSKFETGIVPSASCISGPGGFAGSITLANNTFDSYGATATVTIRNTDSILDPIVPVTCKILPCSRSGSLPRASKQNYNVKVRSNNTCQRNAGKNNCIANKITSSNQVTDKCNVTVSSSNNCKCNSTDSANTVMTSTNCNTSDGRSSSSSCASASSYSNYTSTNTSTSTGITHDKDTGNGSSSSGNSSVASNVKCVPSKGYKCSLGTKKAAIDEHSAVKNKICNLSNSYSAPSSSTAVKYSRMSRLPLAPTIKQSASSAAVSSTAATARAAKVTRLSANSDQHLLLPTAKRGLPGKPVAKVIPKAKIISKCQAVSSRGAVSKSTSSSTCSAPRVTANRVLEKQLKTTSNKSRIVPSASTSRLVNAQMNKSIGSTRDDKKCHNTVLRAINNPNVKCSAATTPATGKICQANANTKRESLVGKTSVTGNLCQLASNSSTSCSSTSGNSSDSDDNDDILSPIDSVTPPFETELIRQDNILCESSTSVLLPKDVILKYKLGSNIGDGNFAIVHECLNRHNNTPYALKIIDKSKCKGRESMIANEVAILKRITHPNIIQFIDQFDYPNELYLITELVKGGDLFDAIAEANKYNELDASGMMYDLTSALAYLHSRNICHRDIKPENLLVCDYSPPGRNAKTLKLADFGLAVELPAGGQLFDVCGTPNYVAPEILCETGYDHKVDVWAAGVIAYVLLCGFPPFVSPDNDQDELFDQILSGQFDFPSDSWDHIGEPVKNLIKSMLNVNQSLRPTPSTVLRHPWIQKGSSFSHSRANDFTTRHPSR